MAGVFLNLRETALRDFIFSVFLMIKLNSRMNLTFKSESGSNHNNDFL